MSDIQWLEPRTEKSMRTIPEGADVLVKTFVKEDKSCYTAISFYNDSHLKISHNGRMMVGITDTTVYLKEPEGLSKGRKIAVNKGSNTKRVQISNVNFKEIFKNIGGMQGYFKLQHSVSKDCWFIAESGKVADL